MLAAIVGVAIGDPALAQAPSPTDSTALTLGEVVITGNPALLSTRRILSSVDIVPAERVERQIITHNWQLFDQVPGAMITQFGQGNVSGKFSMRAFNGEGEINAVKLLIDGVPGNSNDGNMPYLELVPMLDIESIEVVRGTNDPRYGLHNIAGNANIATRQAASSPAGSRWAVSRRPTCKPRRASIATASARTTHCRHAAPMAIAPTPKPTTRRSRASGSSPRTADELASA